MKIETVEAGMRRVDDEYEKVVHYSLQNAKLEKFATNRRIRTVQVSLDVQGLSHLEDQIHPAFAVCAKDTAIVVMANKAQSLHGRVHAKHVYLVDVIGWRFEVTHLVARDLEADHSSHVVTVRRGGHDRSSVDIGRHG